MENYQELKQAMEIAASNNALDILLQNLFAQRRQPKRLAVATVEEVVFYNIDDIIHLEAYGNYSLIHLVNQPKVTVSKTLKEYEEILPADVFLRVHHSHLININCIRRYIKGNGGQIELINGRLIDVSRRKKEEFLHAIKF